MIVFKYQPISKLTLQNLSAQKNWVSDPKNYNDPFEFRYKDGSYWEDGKLQYPDLETVDRLEVIRKTISDFGVVCYSDKHDINLLWAHYADNHKGMCLVFDVPAYNRGKLLQVDYREDLVEINLENSEITNLYPVVMSKSVDWRYEREYREVYNEKNILKDYPGELTGIYFGCKTPFEDIKLVRDIVVAQNPKIFLGKMTMARNHYLLDSGKISDPTKLPDTWKEVDNGASIFSKMPRKPKLE